MANTSDPSQPPFGNSPADILRQTMSDLIKVPLNNFKNALDNDTSPEAKAFDLDLNALNLAELSERPGKNQVLFKKSNDSFVASKVQTSWIAPANDQMQAAHDEYSQQMVSGEESLSMQQIDDVPFQVIERTFTDFYHEAMDTSDINFNTTSGFQEASVGFSDQGWMGNIEIDTLTTIGEERDLRQDLHLRIHNYIHPGVTEVNIEFDYRFHYEGECQKLLNMDGAGNYLRSGLYCYLKSKDDQVFHNFPLYIQAISRYWDKPFRMQDERRTGEDGFQTYKGVLHIYQDRPIAGNADLVFKTKLECVANGAARTRASVKTEIKEVRLSYRTIA
ncbi:MAG: hypothetical protein AAF587_27660 [Bacteroidota bacterium]